MKLQPQAVEKAYTVSIVTAKTRKRCPYCGKMIEVGEEAALTDDRYRAEKISYFGRSYPRGAWHLWHVECERKRREVSP